MQPSVRRQNKKRSKDFWANHIKKWAQSGQTQISYCQKNGLGPKAFIYWKSKLKKESQDVSFFPVPLRAYPKPAGTIRPEPLKLICNNRYRIEVGENFSPDTLKKLIQTIERL